MTLAPLPKPPGANSLFLPLPIRVFVVPRTISHFGPLCFQQLAHSSAIRWGWGGRGPDFRISNFAFRSRSALSSFFPYSYELFCHPQFCNSFIFKRFQTLSQKHPGAGIHLYAVIPTEGRDLLFLYLLYFLNLLYLLFPNSFRIRTYSPTPRFFGF
jgi:hypothetical protein